MNVIYHSFLEIAREKESFLRKNLQSLQIGKERKGEGIKKLRGNNPPRSSPAAIYDLLLFASRRLKYSPKD